MCYDFYDKVADHDYISIKISYRKPLTDDLMSGYLELCLLVPGTLKFRDLTVYKFETK